MRGRYALRCGAPDPGRPGAAGCPAGSAARRGAGRRRGRLRRVLPPRVPPDPGRRGHLPAAHRRGPGRGDAADPGRAGGRAGSALPSGAAGRGRGHAQLADPRAGPARRRGGPPARRFRSVRRRQDHAVRPDPGPARRHRRGVERGAVRRHRDTRALAGTRDTCPVRRHTARSGDGRARPARPGAGGPAGRPVAERPAAARRRGRPAGRAGARRGRGGRAAGPDRHVPRRVDRRLARGVREAVAAARAGGAPAVLQRRCLPGGIRALGRARSGRARTSRPSW